MRRFFRRAPASSSCRLCSLKAALGGLATVVLVGLMAQAGGDMLMIAPLAASSVLVCATPRSPMAQPANVVGGHIVSTVTALALDAALPDTWWAAAAAVGAAILVMEMLRVTHPPAGADALVVMTIHAGLDYLLFPIAIGSLAVVASAVALHRLVPPRAAYPAMD